MNHRKIIAACLVGEKTSQPIKDPPADKNKPKPIKEPPSDETPKTS